ncbi:MAG TPA: Rrf2 family transcriptional regulator [Synergistaceae bacterium]|nr:Rrf2 family transcriptional regulator [Synergistaceae bacterium]HPQ36559.1 Rrf2 family transcriptional regulator [Synergistaceae bacterium]
MHSFFHFSEAASLGLHGMALLACREERVSIKEMAEILEVSEAHLAKVFQRLVKSGLVISHRGPGGGFDLAFSPEEISLMDIYEALEGPLEMETCLLHRSECPFGKCFLGKPLREIEALLISFFRETKLDTLRKKE